MNVYIPGMDMPTSCETCDLRVNRSLTNVPDFVCIATGGLTFYCSKSEASKRQKVSKEYLWNCPLVPVSPHGRLIDADALIEDLKYDVELDEVALDSIEIVNDERRKIQNDKDIKQNCIFWIENAPSIIPATKVK